MFNLTNRKLAKKRTISKIRIDKAQRIRDESINLYKKKLDQEYRNIRQNMIRRNKIKNYIDSI